MKSISKPRNVFRRFLPGVLSLAAMLVVALAPTISEARGPHGEGPSEERMLGHLQYRLNLTPEQMEKVRPVVREENAKLQIFRAEHHRKMAENRAEFRKEMDAHRNRLGERLNDVLTPEQKEEFKKMNEERRARMVERMGTKGGRGKGCK